MYNGLIDRLERDCVLTFDEYLTLIEHRDECRDYLAQKAAAVRDRIYGKRVFIRGLIEFSNYCKNNCYYCGIRAENRNLQRYRLTVDEILNCADSGYSLGFRTFVLQGGEDTHYSDEDFCKVITTIKQKYPECAVTLSLGERSFESYKALKEAGADRYLLRHETCNKEHYEKLHPAAMSYANRMRCIDDLKSLGYQVGVGFMVGSPYQTNDDLANEMLFIKQVNPQMVGIGPFIPHRDTPFGDRTAGTAELTTFMLSLIRLTLPNVLLPATTALGTIDPMGREKGIMAGANVLMPNLSPADAKSKYMLYDGKICTGDEAAQCVECLKLRIEKTGCHIVTDRGDYINQR
ncbi:MAG: [Eubacterium sp.]|nr:[FeFe] hydrogenase H-cluster radical SAM maturase HydE [Eubacterium sp.]MBR0412918.1 [FeFe] hydrogenase H-cluster radical SAM maturase HydE [Eubacterium sp.]